MLKEALITQAEIMDLRSTSKGFVEGVIIESSTVQGNDLFKRMFFNLKFIKGLGKVCTMIVNRGTLKPNSFILSGTVWGKIKTMHDEFNKPINIAGPSCPVRISGIFLFFYFNYFKRLAR